MRLPPRAWQLALQLTALLCATLLLPQVGLIRALEQLSVDWRFITRGVRAPTERIVIVEIDQDSLDALPEPTIFWGKYHGQVISTLHDLGARAIGFDVLQPNPLSEYLGDGEDPDSAWAEALFGAPETVLIYQLSHLPDGTTAQIVPAPQLNYALALAGGQLGFSTTEPDDDQVIRRQPLADSTEGDEEHVAFPLSVASVVTGEEVSIGEDSVSLGKFVLPTDEQRRLPINFRGAARTFPHVSYLEVLRSPEKHREQLKDAFVLVGNTVLAFHDFHTVPYSRLQSDQLPLMSGIEIHANTLHTVLAKDFLRIPRGFAATLPAVLLLAVSVPVFAFGPVWASALGLLLLGGGWTGFAFWIFRTGNLQLPVAAPVATLVLSYLVFAVGRLIHERQQRQHVEGVFGKYVSDDVVDYLLTNPEAVGLGGQRREVSILFSDIRGFTTMSEQLEPEEVTRVMNEYLTRMVDIVFENGGTVDKYIGDAIMAVFGWPLEQPDHARRAVRTAVQMQEALGPLGDEWRARGMPAIGIGVGVNTGSPVIGNIGHPRRMEQTSLGDTVNVASRLEGMNKELDTDVLITQATYERVTDSFEFGEPQEIKVKGREEALRVYPVVGMKA